MNLKSTHPRHPEELNLCVTWLGTCAGVVHGELWFELHHPTLCRVIASVCTASCFCSLMSIMAISINRYVHICHHQVTTCNASESHSFQVLLSQISSRMMQLHETENVEQGRGGSSSILCLARLDTPGPCSANLGPTSFGSDSSLVQPTAKLQLSQTLAFWV